MDGTPRTGEGPVRPPSTGVPWIETRAGALFFLNAVLVAPVAMVAFPLLVGWIVRGAGWLVGPSPMFDTIPRLAHYFAPRLGWLAAPAAFLAWKGVRETGRPGPRIWTGGFLLVHLATFGYTVLRWVTG